MVVVAGHVVDDRVERGRAVGEGQVREEAEHHGAHLIERQGQVQDVSRQDEGRRPVLTSGELAQPADQAAEQRARPLRIGGEASAADTRGPLVERGQHAVLGPEMQVGQDDVADVGHEGPRSLSALPASAAVLASAALLASVAFLASRRAGPKTCHSSLRNSSPKESRARIRPASVGAVYPECRQLPGEVGRRNLEDPRPRQPFGGARPAVGHRDVAVQDADVEGGGLRPDSGQRAGPHVLVAGQRERPAGGVGELQPVEHVPGGRARVGEEVERALLHGELAAERVTADIAAGGRGVLRVGEEARPRRRWRS